MSLIRLWRTLEPGFLAELEGSDVIIADKKLIEAWKELPEDDRLMLYLVDVEQLGREKVAMILEHSTVVVKYRTDLARAKLKRKLMALCGTADLCVA